MAMRQDKDEEKRKPVLARKRLAAPTPTNAPVLCVIRTGCATGSRFVGTLLTTLNTTLADVRELLVTMAHSAQRGDSGPIEAQQRKLVETPPVNVTGDELDTILSSRLHPFDLCAPFSFVRSGGCVAVSRSKEQRTRVADAIPATPPFGLPPTRDPQWVFKPASPLAIVARKYSTKRNGGDSGAGAEEEEVRLCEAQVVLFVSQGSASRGGLQAEKVMIERLIMQQEAYGRPYRVKPLMSMTNKWNANIPDYMGRTILMEAVLAGSEAAVKYLVPMSFVRVNAADSRGNTALHYAIVSGDMILVSILVEAGADVLKDNANGETPLHTALLLRNDACVDILCRRLRAQGTPAAKLKSCVNNIGMTPLDLFAMYSPTFRQVVDEGDLDAVKALYKHYLFDRKTVTQRDGLLRQTVLHAAAENGHTNVVLYLLDELHLPDLMQRSPQMGMVDSRNQTPLHLAAKHGHLPLMKVLIQRFPDHLEELDINGRTPLLSALYNGNIVSAEFIASASAAGAVSVEILDRSGYAALHYACVLQRHSLVQLLMEKHEASVNTRITAHLLAKEKPFVNLPDALTEPEDFLRVSRSLKGRYATLRQRRKPEQPKYATVETLYEGPTPLWCAVRIAVTKCRQWYDAEALRCGNEMEPRISARDHTGSNGRGAANGKCDVEARRTEMDIRYKRLMQRLPPILHQPSVDLVNYLLDKGAGQTCSAVEVQDMVRQLLLVNNVYVAEQLIPLLDIAAAKSNATLCALCERQVTVAIRWCVEKKLCALNSVDGGWPLYVSASVGDIETVRFLLSHGASPDIAGNAKTPLLAAIRGKHTAVVEELLMAGAKPISSDPQLSFRTTPLTVAALEQVESVVRGLIGLATVPTRELVHALTSVLQRVWVMSERHVAICTAIAHKIVIVESPVHPTELLHLAACKKRFDVVGILADKLLALPRDALAQLMSSSPPAPQRLYKTITATVMPVSPKLKRLVANRATGRKGLYTPPKEFRRLELERRTGNADWQHRHQLRDVFSYCAESKQLEMIHLLLLRLHMTPWRGADIRGWNAADYALESKQYDIARLLAASGTLPYTTHNVTSGTALSLFNRALPDVPGTVESKPNAPTAAGATPWYSGEEAALSSVVLGIIRQNVSAPVAQVQGRHRKHESLAIAAGDMCWGSPSTIQNGNRFAVESASVLRAFLRDVCLRHELNDLSAGGEWVEAAVCACVCERRLDLLRVFVDEFQVGVRKALKGARYQLLPVAAANRDSDTVTFLLHRGAPPHVPSDLPLHLGSLLVDSRLTPKEKHARRTALYIAALNNDTTMMESLSFSAPLTAETCTNKPDVKCDALSALVNGASSQITKAQQERLAKTVAVLARAGHLYTSPLIMRCAARKRLHLVVAAIIENYGGRTILADLKSDEVGALHYIAMDGGNEEVLRELLKESQPVGEGARSEKTGKTAGAGSGFTDAYVGSNPICAALRVRDAATSPLIEALRRGCANNSMILLAAGVTCDISPSTVVSPVNTACFCGSSGGDEYSSIKKVLTRTSHQVKMGKLVGSNRDFVICHRLGEALKLRAQRRQEWDATENKSTNRQQASAAGADVLATEAASYTILHAVAELNYPDIFQRLIDEMLYVCPAFLRACTLTKTTVPILSIALRHADGSIAGMALRAGLTWGGVMSSRTIFEMLCCRIVARTFASRNCDDPERERSATANVDVATLLSSTRQSADTYSDAPFDVTDLARNNYNVWAVMQAMRRNFLLMRDDLCVCVLTGLTSAIVLNNLEAVRDLVLAGVCSPRSSAAQLSTLHKDGQPDQGAPSYTSPRFTVQPLVLAMAILARTPTQRLSSDAAVRMAGPRTRADLVASMQAGVSAHSANPAAGSLSSVMQSFTDTARAATRWSGSTSAYSYVQYGTQFDTQLRIIIFLLEKKALEPELINPLAIVAARLKQWSLLEAIIDAAIELHRPKDAAPNGGNGTREKSQSVVSERFFSPLADHQIPTVLARHIGSARHVFHVVARNAPRDVVVLVARYSNRRDVESAVDASGRTAMYHAIHHPHTSSFDTLLSLRVPFTTPCCMTTHRPPLLVAARHGNAHAVSALIKQHAPVDACDEHGNTALTLASAAGHVAVVELLLSADASTALVNSRGMTAVMAAARGGHDDIALALSQHFCTASDFRTDTTTLLHCAAMGGCERTTESLLHMWDRANIFESDADGHTPLYLAYAFGNAHVLRLLLSSTVQRGQKPTAEVDIAIVSCSSTINRFGWLRGVLRVGQALLTEAQSRFFGLQDAARPGELPYQPRAKALGSMRSRLLWCARYNHPIGVRVLADLNVADDVGALQTAASRGHTDVVQLLVVLEMSDPNERSRNGQLAFECAIRHGYAECASFLLQRMKVALSVLSVIPRPPKTLEALSSSLDPNSGMATKSNLFHVIAASRCASVLPELIRRLLDPSASVSHMGSSESSARMILDALEITDSAGFTPFECAVATGSPSGVLRVAQALQVVGHAAKKDTVLSISNALLHCLPTMSPSVRAVLFDFFGVQEVRTMIGFSANEKKDKSSSSKRSHPRLSFADVRLLGINQLRRDPFCVPKVDLVCTVAHERAFYDECIAPKLPFKAAIDLSSSSSAGSDDSARYLQWLGSSLLAGGVGQTNWRKAQIDAIQFRCVPHRTDVFVTPSEKKGTIQVGFYVGMDSITMPDVSTVLNSLTGGEDADLLKRVEKACKHIARRLRKLPHASLKSTKIVVDWDAHNLDGTRVSQASAYAPNEPYDLTHTSGDARVAPRNALECLLEKGLPRLLYLAEVTIPNILAALTSQELRAISSHGSKAQSSDVTVSRIAFRYTPNRAGSLVAKDGAGGGAIAPIGGGLGSIIVPFNESGVDSVERAMNGALKALQRDANLVHIHHIRDHFVKHVFNTCGTKMGGELLKFKLELEGAGIEQIPLHLFEEALRNTSEALAAVMIDATPTTVSEADREFRLQDLKSSAIVANSVARGVRTIQVLFSTKRAPVVKRSGSKLLFSFTPDLIPTRSDIYDALRELTVEMEIDRIKELLPSLVLDMGQRLNTFLPSSSLVVDTASIVDDDDDENVLAALALLAHNHGALVFQALVEGIGVGWDTQLGSIIRKATRQVTITLERGSVGTVTVLPGGHVVYYCPLHCVQRGFYRHSSWCLLTSQQIASLMLIQLSIDHREVRRLVHKSKAFACWTRVHGRNSHVVTAGQQRCRLLIESRNILNLPIRKGGEKLLFTCHSISAFQVSDKKDGSYEVSFEAPKRAGRFTVNATLHSMPLFNSPLTICVRPRQTDLPRTTLLSAYNTVVEGLPFTVRLQLHDRFGNSIERTEKELKVEGPPDGNDEKIIVRSWRQTKADTLEVTVCIGKEQTSCTVPIRLSTSHDSHVVPVTVECISKKQYKQVCTLRCGHPLDTLGAQSPVDRIAHFYRKAYQQSTKARWQRDALSVGGVFNRVFPDTVQVWWRHRRQMQRAAALRRLQRMGKAKRKHAKKKNADRKPVASS